jgi:hypothetical protein
MREIVVMDVEFVDSSDSKDQSQIANLLDMISTSSAVRSKRLRYVHLPYTTAVRHYPPNMDTAQTRVERCACSTGKCNNCACNKANLYCTDQCHP